MTKTHYIELAARLHAARVLMLPERDAPALLEGLDIAVSAMCDVMARDNPRFNRTQFYAAVHDG